MTLLSLQQLGVLIGRYGVVVDVARAFADVWPEIVQAVELFDDEEFADLEGVAKAAAIVDQASDILDALDNHIPGLKDALTEEQRDAILAWAGKAVLGMVEISVAARRISEVVVEAQAVYPEPTHTNRPGGRPLLRRLFGKLRRRRDDDSEIGAVPEDAEIPEAAEAPEFPTFDGDDLPDNLADSVIDPEYDEACSSEASEAPAEEPAAEPEAPAAPPEQPV